jgi:hypothetical protein
MGIYLGRVRKLIFGPTIFKAPKTRHVITGDTQLTPLLVDFLIREPAFPIER